MTSQFRPPKPETLHARTAWISDVHLGNKDCKARYLLDFLNTIECDTLYLVGDIIDIWSMSRNFHWPASHSQVIRRIIDKSREGCRVIYIPGNHDMSFREYVRESFGGIEVHDRYLHITEKGKRLLVVHGDELDNVIRFNPFLQLIGDHAYDLLLLLNRCNTQLRKLLGRDYWSLAGYIKTRIGKAMKAIEVFEDAAMDLARKQGLDGIICGHIHHPNMRIKDGIMYCNDGDWIENCTAMVEAHDGTLEIVHWSEKVEYHNVCTMLQMELLN